jgi:hypothetical protein
VAILRTLCAANLDCVSGSLSRALRSGLTYISAMPKRTPRIKLFEWRVIKIRGTPAALVGYFTAANADDAIKRDA